MKMQNALIPTLRDIPAEAVISSHQLLLKAGFINKTAAGMYNYLPLGKRVLSKIEKIVRDEMDRFGGQEILMPIIQPAELWEESGRWDAYGEEMWRVTDRHNREFCLGPTHEEMITDLVRQMIGSYKSLPVRLYQIQNKYRDERRPRFGLMRGREFIMKDLYSFDLTEEGLDQCYQDMYDAYNNIFKACGLNFRAVLADSGQIGGGYTHEFMALAENGEATVAYCSCCDYAANNEIAECVNLEINGDEEQLSIDKISTPNIKTIEELTGFLNIKADQCIKTLLFKADDNLVAVLTLGTHQVNELKLKKIHPCNHLELATDEEVFKKIGVHIGSLGPVNIPDDVLIYADHGLKNRRNLVAGANEDDSHIKHVNLDRDTNIKGYFDLRLSEEGELCPKCQNPLHFARGIEVGQIFKLGTKYSEAMNATVLDENGKNRVLLMGCYGIGVSRTLAAIVEQCHDEKGIIWPKNVSPYQVHLILVNGKDEDQSKIAEAIYDELLKANIEVLYDNRKERVGVKFNDADLIGIPLRLTIGKKSISDGVIEWKERMSNETLLVEINEIVKKIHKYYQ